MTSYSLKYLCMFALVLLSYMHAGTLKRYIAYLQLLSYSRHSSRTSFCKPRGRISRWLVLAAMYTMLFTISNCHWEMLEWLPYYSKSPLPAEGFLLMKNGMPYYQARVVSTINTFDHLLSILFVVVLF